jgi:hypothetical protein
MPTNRKKVEFLFHRGDNVFLARPGYKWRRGRVDGLTKDGTRVVITLWDGSEIRAVPQEVKEDR